MEACMMIGLELCAVASVGFKSMHAGLPESIYRSILVSCVGICVQACMETRDGI